MRKVKSIDYAKLPKEIQRLAEHLSSSTIDVYDFKLLQLLDVFDWSQELDRCIHCWAWTYITRTGCTSPTSNLCEDCLCKVGCEDEWFHNDSIRE
jgi:hypothetical protein